MKFSVVIPCYNAERWIDYTLKTVADQTLPPHEVIVIDDGSTDDSLARLQTSPIPITLIETQNGGPAHARNLGIEQATGEWVAFLDADDWWKPDHLERIQNLVSHSQDVVYLAAAEHYSINVDRIVSRSDTSAFSEPVNHLDHSTYFQLYLKYGLLELSSMAVQLERLQEVGGFNAEFQGAEDFELMLRIVHGKTLAYDPVPSSVYRCNNPESYSRRVDLNSQQLTVKFRTLKQHRVHYNISDSMLKSLGRTAMSKAITQCDPKARQEVRQLVNPYLSNPQKLLFTLASQYPGLYHLGNTLRNTLKGQNYRPRQVINSGSSTSS